MQYNNRDRAFALAGIFQATRLVQQVARTGMTEQTPLETSITSIFQIDADTPEAVYGGASGLELGFKTLLAQLNGQGIRNNEEQTHIVETTKYAINAMVLERKLVKRADLMSKIVEGISTAQTQLQHYSVTHNNVIANLAHIYSETVSTLNPRIMVSGEHHHITNTDNANKIRALLLAAIRSAVLWRQCGGTRWQILFKRKQIVDTVEKILA